MIQVLAILLLSHQHVIAPEFEGIASYYTVESSSSTTASGEPMSDAALTCALPEGEFGSYYRFSAENGRTVICRLNDRGPHIKGRIADLSEAAMRALHPTAGLIQVTVDRVPDSQVPELLKAQEKQLARRFPRAY